MSERLGSVENQSLWKSRLFKAGIALAVVGALVKSSPILTVGVIAVGGAWALWRGNK